MKATDWLMKQHREVETLFRKILESDSTRHRKAFAAELRLALEVHMAIEEDIFYPAYRDAAETDEVEGLVVQACKEHDALRHLLSELPHLDAADRSFTSVVTALEQLVEAHVRAEEQELFPDAIKLLGKARLEEMRREMEDREMLLAA